MNEELRQRVVAITDGLGAIQNGWPFLLAEVEDRIRVLTDDLVSVNNEETRGRIKGLVSIRNLPDTLEQERVGLIAALSEQDAA